MSTIQDLSGLSAEEKRALLRQMLQDKIARSPREFPLTYGQRALWFLHQLSPESAAYNVLFAVRLRSALDRGALRRALQCVTDRHGALRTTFALRGEQPVQIVHPQREVALDEVDARGWSEAELRRRVSAEAYRPFDLQTGPLFRGTVFHCRDDEYVLLFAVHHIVGDYWSQVVLLSELQQVYPTCAAGSEP